jgi:hypothetical protein
MTAAADARAARERALYLYGVAASGTSLPDLRGVDPAFSVSVLEHAGLAAIVSEVTLGEFGHEALKANLNRLEWLEACARAHEEVLDRALETGAVLPARLATVYEDERNVRELLERERGVFAAQLERLRDKREWGVKGSIAEDRLHAWLESSDDELRALRTAGAPKTEGTAYMARKKYERLVESRSAEAKARCAETTHAALARHAERAQVNPLRRTALEEGDGDPVLNAVYLVARADEKTFLAAAEQLREEQRALGLRLEVTGPWPPYNFVTEPKRVG